MPLKSFHFPQGRFYCSALDWIRGAVVKGVCLDRVARTSRVVEESNKARVAVCQIMDKPGTKLSLQPNFGVIFANLNAIGMQ